ncbi:uncharacterized protein PV07_04914 [Cladophialophora immunda]|uniref:Uncharacterized protein n=1 Tax=Cladophialophora immunda TaxID=569365 RepID=A0A0D1ZMA6_9EURO|nr:uncharacterized protein PV07_04914 [Cladophialophora immunda]KIW29071.1 hypothetical protein PV07_04914 [Cladophialophora immunda]
MPRPRRVAQPREGQACGIRHRTSEPDHPVLSTNACAAEELAGIQTLDRPTHVAIGRSRGREDAGHIYRSGRVRYPIFEVKLGVYRINYLSKPMTEEEMRRSMPLLKLGVSLYCLGVGGLIVFLLLLLGSLV